MARRCTVCAHPRRKEIDQAIVDCEPDRSIAKRFGLSPSAIFRHRHSHLAKRLTRAVVRKEAKEAKTLLKRVEDTVGLAARIFKEAYSEENVSQRDYNICLRAVREMRAGLALILKAEGELPPTQVNIFLNPQWVELRTLILQTVEPYPEAHFALVEALKNGNGAQ